MFSKTKKANEKQGGVGNICTNISRFVIIITCAFLTLFLVLLIPSMFFSYERNPMLDAVRLKSTSSPRKITVKPDRCAGKYIYIIDLPSEFNTYLLETCRTLSPWTDACRPLTNSGLGLRLNVTDGSVFLGSSWYDTDQFSLEVIFHNRMKHYSCLTSNYSEASAIFVPYYAGLDVGRYLWISNETLRDETSVKFSEFIRQKPEWKRFRGRDHFLIVGRVTLDFSRGTRNTTAADKAWGNRLLLLPEIKNMTSLLLESNHTSISEISIPYPTYFHPNSRNEVDNWQQEMRQKKRIYLFSFAGAPRPSNNESIRNILIKQCLGAKDQNCKYVHTNPDVKPETVMGLFQISDFCLQPPGDSFTRKSMFDTILSGCIPVLFHPGSAYVQYVWYLPKDYSTYSVFIPMDELKQGTVSIEKRLLEIPKEQVLAMREVVIKLIPSIVYANPNSKVDSFEDAFDVAVKGVLNRVKTFKTEMEGGKIGTSESGFEHHEWDKYFDESFGVQ